MRRFDKGGEAFYDQISALHKSVRGSNPDAALYWLARMLDGGCDPLYLARRVVRMASEDIGNADPRALALAWRPGKCRSASAAPKANWRWRRPSSIWPARRRATPCTWPTTARRDAAEYGSLEVPLHLRNAPTKLMKELGYGDGYRYAHDEPDAYAAGEHYFPDEMPERHYYQPVPRGLEIKIGEKLAHLRELDRKAGKK